MLKLKNILVMLFVAVIMAGSANAALIWSDEFDGSSLNTSNWSYDIGDGCPDLCGWGNSELEYYRAENVSVSGGYLIIEAREEAYGGRDYTSGKIHSQYKRDFLYGRIEARMKIPTGGGMWPAFWMMPTDSVYGTWALSGEIDIMEASNATDHIGGTIHFGGVWPWNVWSSGDYNPGGVNFGDAFHVYAIEWEPDRIRWYVDGILFSTKTNSQWWCDEAPDNPRAPFDQYFYIIINAAVGGTFTGCTSPSCITADLPQQYLVDWVRVYDSGTPTTTTSATTTTTTAAGSLPALIEAEDYTSMNGIDTETCSEGGLNVGWIDAGDWMEYAGWYIPGGTYTVEYRVASSPGGGQLRLELDGGATQFPTLSVPGTGGWQNWTTISQTVTLPSGTHDIMIYAPAGGWNINWFEFTSGGTTTTTTTAATTTTTAATTTTTSGGYSLPALIEAEDYTSMSGIETESCSEGGLNVGWIDAGDWMEYADWYIPGGTYTVEYRVASNSGGGQLRLELDGGATQFPTLSVPGTGGWQDWTTISQTVTLPSGTHDIMIYAPAGGWNINWFEFTSGGTTTTTTSATTTTTAPGGKLALSNAVASSEEYPAYEAIDGNTGTRWASEWSTPQWIYVDLGQSYNINRVVLNWEAAYGQSYQIQVSDNASSWTDIYSTTNGNGGIDDIALSGSGRYVRMYGTVRGLETYGYSLWEFEVYGD